MYHQMPLRDVRGHGGAFTYTLFSACGERGVWSKLLMFQLKKPMLGP
jgi:hypothetical protein